MAGQCAGTANFIERSVILSTGAVLNGSLSELARAKLSVPVTLKEAEARTSFRLSSRQMVWSVARLVLLPDWACRGRH
jgi:hypothetical protein